MISIDVFIDLSACEADAPVLAHAFSRWAEPENLGAIARRVAGALPPQTRPDALVSLPSGWAFSQSDSPTRALSAALATAGNDGVPLLLIIGLVDVNSDAVGMLHACLERDPLFGFAVPRTACADRCCFARLSPHGTGSAEWLPRKILAELPDTEIIVEIGSVCTLIGPQVLRNFGPLSREFDAVAAAMLHYMAGARRCGFRTVLSNRAVVGVDRLMCDNATAQLLPDLTPHDRALLNRVVPDFQRSWGELRAGSRERFERLCITIRDMAKPGARPSLLIDVRNMGPIYNGTSQALLGTLSAFKELQADWEISLLATPEGAAFHDLDHGYADWRVYTSPPERAFTVAVRPSQPWHIREMIDLHNVSLLNVYLMLDSIAWDIGYATPSHLEGTWQFLADHADGLLFDSEFSHRRFIERFPQAHSVPRDVVHFSFDPSEYALPSAVGAASDEEFILVIGNDLDHKDVRNTVEALASGFPFRRIRALGPASTVSPLVTAHRSGELAEVELHRLYAAAQFVVFPSFYEGFGFPIVTALGYGRTVLARRSALLDEIAANCVNHGRLVVFDSREELVELLGRLVHGEPVPEHPLGGALGNSPPRRWRNVAQDIVAFLGPLASQPSHRRWIDREHVVKQILAYRT